MNTAYVLEFPFPLCPDARFEGGAPHHIGTGADLNHILPLQLWMFMATHQIHMMTI